MSGNSLQATQSEASVADFSALEVAGTLKMPCLGRPFQLGMLYDCRSDALIPDVTLWGSKAISIALSEEPFEKFDLRVIAEDSLREKFITLDVDASLKLSILSGLVQVEGAAKFLSDHKSSKKHTRVSLQYSSTTRREQLKINQLGNIEYTDVFHNDIATHVVTGLVYGGDAFFVFDREVGENEDMKKIHEDLRVKVGGLPELKNLAIGDKGFVDVNAGDKKDEELLHCTFYGDVILPKHPATFCDAVQVYQELPELLKNKSVPKKVCLYPLGRLDNKVQRIVREITPKLIDELLVVMEYLHDGIMRSNELINTEVCSKFLNLKYNLESMKELICEYRAHLGKKLAFLLPKVQGGEAEETKVAEVHEENRLSPFNSKTLSSWIFEKENEVNILAVYCKHLKQQEVIELAFKSGQDIEAVLLATSLEMEAVLCFDFGITWGKDAQLMQMKAYLHNGRESQGKESPPQPWYKNQVFMREMYQQFLCFRSFAFANQCRERTKFVVTNTDSDNDTESAFVSLYEKYCKSKFEVPDKPGKPQISNISYTGLQVNWEMPKYSASVQSYTVLYTDDESSDQWCTQTTSGAEQQVVFSGLIPGTAYCFKVRAETSIGCSPDSDVYKTRLPPGAPGRPHATKVTKNSVKLIWAKPTHGAETVQAYSIFCHSSDRHGWMPCSSVQKEIVNISGLVPKTVYTFKVRAESAAGPSPDSEISAAIKTISLLSQPGKPTVAKLTHDSVTLKWEEPQEGFSSVHRYTVFYQRSLDGPHNWSTCTTSGTQTSAHLSGLVPNTQYVFLVRAESATGESSDSEVSNFKTLLPISQPSKPFATKVSHNCVTLKWGKPKRGGNAIDHYTLFYQSSDNPANKWSTFKTTSPLVMANVPDLVSNRIYIFKVRAESAAAGSSPVSEASDSVKTVSPISQPGKPIGTSMNINSIAIEWSKPKQGDHLIRCYSVVYYPADHPDECHIFKASKASGPVESVHLPGLSPKTVYRIKVRAESDAGASPDSDLSDPIMTAPPISAPGKPVAVNVTHNCITLKWARPEQGAEIVEYYTVLLSTQNKWTPTCTPHRQEFIDLTGLASETVYKFMVRAESTTLGASPESVVSDPIKTLLPVSAPGKPIATFVTHNSITLEWAKPEFGANTVKQYHLMYRGIDFPQDNWFPLRSSGSEAKAELAKYVDPNSVYFFKVRAETSSGFSPESEVSDPIQTKLIPPPGKPSASNITYEGFQLNWNKPPYDDIQHYIVSYQFTDAPPNKRKWHTLSVDGSKENTNFAAAEKKLHVFKVAAVTALGTTSDSEQSDPIETKTVPWGVKLVKNLAPLPDTNPPTYLLPTHCVMERKGVHKVHVGMLDNPKARTKSGVTTGCSCHNHSQTGVQHKVLMVVGATGAGKTTLINGMANYILGIQWNDDFRFKLIAEPNSQDQTVSQTSCITAYTFYKESGSPLPYTLTVIDTPGFGDTGGLTRDKQIVQQIKELFSIAGDEGIDQLHGIGFVTQAPLARLTPTQRYVFDAILSVFGRDVAGNIFLMITFADGMPPPVVDAVKAAGVPYQEFFKFNNSAFFAKKSAKNEFDKMFWKMGTNSFTEFFKQFSTAKTQSLQQTREVIQEREKLQTIIQGLQPQIQAGLTKIDVLIQKKKILSNHEDAILSKKKFTYEVTETRQRVVDLDRGTYVTNCLVCNYTCHERCAYADDGDKYLCSAMGEGCGTKSAKCGVCVGKCSWDEHKNNKYRFELYTVNVTKTSDELKKEYDSAMDSKDEIEKVIRTMKKELDALNTAVLHKIDEARRCIARLQQIALKPDHLTEVGYIDILIESEKREAKDRWLERVQALEGVRQQAQIVTELRRNPERQQHSLSSAEESPQEKVWWKKILGSFTS